MSDVLPRPSDHNQPRWQPISAIDRRVAGVLVEKAKTTPDGYPMSVNSLKSGCNQKNNRYPLMEVESEDVEESLARLRAVGAAAEVQGGGRVPRYRHYMYEWLGVDKVELAVMTELLLRGAQTEDELRGRAARMEPIADVAALRPVLESLKAKGLIVSLTPDGRGHVVTHALYEPRELEKLRIEFQASGGAREMPDAFDATSTTALRPSAASSPSAAHSPAAAAHMSPSGGGSYASQQAINDLRRELEEVRAELADVRKGLDELRTSVGG
jgi:uncharacterized protein